MHACYQTEHGLRPIPRSRSRVIRTTLFELIDAIDDEVSPDEDFLVTRVVQHLCQTGKLIPGDSLKLTLRRASAGH